MTKDALIAWLTKLQTERQDAYCIHQDAFGTHYAAGTADELAGFEEAIATVAGLHSTEFVAEWLERPNRLFNGPAFAEQWREEMA